MRGFTPPYPPPEAEAIFVDVTSDKGLAAGFQRIREAYGEPVDSIVHMVAFDEFSGKPSPLCLDFCVKPLSR